MCNDKEFHKLVQQVHKLNLDELVALCHKITAIYTGQPDGGCGIENLKCPPMVLPPMGPLPTPKVSLKRKSQLNRLKSQKHDTPSGRPLSVTKPKKTVSSSDGKGWDLPWGWNNIDNNYKNKNLIDDKCANFNQGKVDMYLKIKPNVGLDMGVPLITKMNKNNINYLCNALKEIIKYSKNQKRIEKYDNIPFQQVFDENTQNEMIFKQTLEQKLNTHNDVFIAAYGQSGSGKSFLIMGDEKNPLIEGVLDKTLSKLRNENVKSIKILPLQVYLGSTYNAFKGPEGLSNNNQISKENLLKWFQSKDSKKYIIPEFNYLDMIDKEIPLENKHLPNNFNSRYIVGYTDKEVCTKDKFKLNYPPSRNIIDNLFELSTNNSLNLNDSDYQALDVTTFNNQGITDALKYNIFRPIRDMKANPESSRSHLFTIIQVKYPNNKTKLITFADFGGLETHSSGPADFEKKKLVNEGNKVFRRMVQSYMGGNDPTRPNKWDCDNVIGKTKSTEKHELVNTDYINKITKNKEKYNKFNINNDRIINQIDLKHSYQSSAVFNIVRGTSGLFSHNKCEHIIYINVHGYTEKDDIDTMKMHCNTTNTVLKFVKEFFGK